MLRNINNLDVVSAGPPEHLRGDRHVEVFDTTGTRNGLVAPFTPSGLVVQRVSYVRIAK